MRTRLTWLVIGAVGLVGVLAIADSLQRGGGPEASPPTTSTVWRAPARPATLREVLRREEVSGLVLYSDDRCLLHSLVLPSLLDEVVHKEGGGDVVRCRFGVGAGRIVGPRDVPSPAGPILARCRGGSIRVWNAESRSTLRRLRGCAPAWDSGGRLTYARSGAVFREGRVLYSQHDLQRLARRHPNVARAARNVPLRVTVGALAWLDRKRLVVALRIKLRGVEPQYLAAVLDGKRMTSLAASFGQPFGSLVVSPAGSFAAFENGTLMARSGMSRDPPSNLPSGRAVAFSPDERWLAYATGASVYLVATLRSSEPGRILHLPVPAQDLVWDPVNRATRLAGLGTG